MAKDQLDNKNGENVVFVLGAGRSGTTLVYKMLCMHSELAWISNYLAHFPNRTELSLLHRITRMFPQLRSNAWFGSSGNAFLTGRNSLLKAVPTPVEGEQIYTQCNIPLFPEKNWQISEAQVNSLRSVFEAIRNYQGCPKFITKRTANNRRIPQLYEAFPKAKYIHIVRDGRAVALSLLKVKWWNDHHLWWMDQKTPIQLETEKWNPMEVAARNWTEEMDEIIEGMKVIPEEQILSVQYENFVDDPHATCVAMGKFIGLNNVEQWVEDVLAIGIYGGSKGWRERMSKEDGALATQIQGSMLTRFGYEL